MKSGCQPESEKNKDNGRERKVDLLVEKKFPATGVVLMRLRGGIDGATSQYLESAVEELEDDDFDRLVLDLSGVGYMSSCGIGLLMRLHNDAAQKGRGLVLLEPVGAVRKVLETTKLLSYYTVTDSREEAFQTTRGLL